MKKKQLKSIQEMRSEVQRETNENKVNIDRSVFQKTKEEKRKLEDLKFHARRNYKGKILLKVSL